MDGKYGRLFSEQDLERALRYAHDNAFGGGVAVAPQSIDDREPESLSDLEQAKLGPFAADSKTSRQAALDTYPRQGSQRRRLITALAFHGASTREELAGHTSMSENSVRPRVRELIDGGWIEETDHTRMTTRGSDATLLDLTFKAREQLGTERHARSA